MNRSCFFALSLFCLFPNAVFAAENLLLNPDFRFTAFEPLRTGKSGVFKSGSVPFWEASHYGGVEVVRGPAVKGFRPRFPVQGAVRIEPGASLSQWVLLSEGRLEPGEPLSLAVDGFQEEGGKLTVSLNAMMTDAEEGNWSPAELGQRDQRSFPKAARGELIPMLLAETQAEPGDFTARLKGVKLPGGEAATATGAVEQEQSGGVLVEVRFENTGTAAAWIYAPRLVHGATAPEEPLEGRAVPDYYRSLPRTVSRLHLGQPLHIIVMGSSIDRASANPPLYRYDESPASPTYKQPLSREDLLFSGKEVGEPELTPYYGRWAHYYSYAGRLRRRLMTRFDLPAEKLLINFMACDGSSIGEAHSALKGWSTLAYPPGPEMNGHAEGRSWKELYPALFSRPEGPRPDLVIFGSGANEKIDGPDEIAVFEGAIRWFQRHYPETEFVIAMWNHQERSWNTAMMQQLALRYGIPYVDISRELHLLSRHVEPKHLTPSDGHPQAAAHDLWGRLLDRAFQMTDAVGSGRPQTQLPERVSPYTVNWEGEMTTYGANSPRFYQRRAFILDDAAFSLWATGAPVKGRMLDYAVNGLPSTDPSFGNGSRRLPMGERNERNSSLAMGRLPLGERHIVEVTTPEATLVAVDAKTALNRMWHPISSAIWQGKPKQPVAFNSEWGAPYGTEQLVLQPGQSVTLEWVGTLASIAWAQQESGGTLLAEVNGVSLKRPTGEPTALADGSMLYMEDRAALPPLPYGVHRLKVSAEGGPVALLGAFTYDTRPNRHAERVQQGMAAPGDRVTFTAPYKATPLVLCTGGLTVQEVSADAVSFSGTSTGSYQIIGQ